MKKFLLVPLFLASSAFALAAGGVNELNAEILKILAPFQNQSTVAELKFSKAETNAERALSLSVSAFYKKAGSLNNVILAIPNVSYEYGDGSSPTTQINGSIGLDLTKVFSQEELNEIVPSVEEMINQLAANFLSQYGDAISIDTKISDRTKDEAGNYTGLKGAISFSIDFSKLPEGQAKEDIVVKAGSASISVEVKKGISVDASIVSNADYKGFQKDNEGLKELLDKLLSQDEATMAQVASFFETLERFANQVANGE